MFFLRVLAVFLGTIIGVGFFGLPFAGQRAGFLTVLMYLIVMGIIAIVVHTYYAEVVVMTPGKKRFPGYVRYHLGPIYEKIAIGVIVFSLFGALLPYLIIGGEFIGSLFGPIFGGDALIYTLIFFSIGSFLVYRDIKNISQTELLFVFLMFSIVFALFFKSLADINVSNLAKVDFNNLFFPYGIALFSLWGASVVPELKELLAKKYSGNQLAKNLKKVISWGLISSTLFYILFTFIVLGVCGNKVSPDSLSGLALVLGKWIMAFGFFFGFACCFTSFLTIAVALKKTLYFDFKVPKNISWFIVCFTPLALFLAGIRNYLSVVSFVGAVSIGIEGVIIILLRQKAKKESIGIIPIIICGVFIFGVIFEIFNVLL